VVETATSYVIGRYTIQQLNLWHLPSPPRPMVYRLKKKNVVGSNIVMVLVIVTSIVIVVVLESCGTVRYTIIGD